MLPGVIGVLQANEALKILVGYGEPLVGRLLMFDAQSTTFRELKLRRDPHCPTCGDGAKDDGAKDQGARDGAAKSEAATPEPALQAAGAGAACT
ncbi:MAG: molybdopterin biosynthesis protein MoeB [Actinobacteria bacterium]|nr:molybdopterin biosynthesis protein MoeB [Actinomycetota bacterium]MEA2591022.1 sulfur-carrier protein adenylyltransferase/sulfurtransferase [Actinomycetota bacterium]